MPTIFSHAVFASAFGPIFSELSRRPMIWVLTALCAALPDADVISFFFGISYGSVLGHRGITHSVAFAILIGVLIATLFFKDSGVSRWKIATYFSLVTLSHPILDMFTNGGRGVALFAPFVNDRFFSPWRPIEVSPIGTDFFGERGLTVFLSEFVWIWLPGILIAGGLLLSRRLFQRDRSEPS